MGSERAVMTAYYCPELVGKLCDGHGPDLVDVRDALVMTRSRELVRDDSMVSV